MKNTQTIENIESPSNRVLSLVEKVRLQRIIKIFEQCPECLGKIVYQHQNAPDNCIIESGKCHCCNHKIESRKFKRQ